MNAEEYLLALDKRRGTESLEAAEEAIATGCAGSLNNDELERLMEKLSPSGRVRILCKEVRTGLFRKEYFLPYDRENYKPARPKTESFDCLAGWLEERTKGKLSYAKKILRENFTGYSFEQQRRILKALLRQAPGDRQFSYERLFGCWDDELMEDILECWNKWHEDKCGELIIRFFPIETVRKMWEELATSNNYYHICKRLGREEWFEPDMKKFSPSTTMVSALEAMAYTRDGIPSEKAEEMLYRVVSVAIYSILANNETMRNGYGPITMLYNGTPAEFVYYFDVRGGDFTQIGDIEALFIMLAKMEKFDVMESFMNWNLSLQDHYRRLRRTVQQQGSRGNECVIDILSLACYLFPEKYRHMLDFSSFTSNTWLNRKWKVLITPRRRADWQPLVEISKQLRTLTADDFGEKILRCVGEQGRCRVDRPGEKIPEEEWVRLIENNPNIKSFVEEMKLEYVDGAYIDDCPF